MHASLFLEQCEATFQHMMEVFKQKQLHQELSFSPPFEIDTPVLVIETEADKQAELQLPLYLSLIGVINLSLVTKASLSVIEVDAFYSIEHKHVALKKKLLKCLEQLLVPEFEAITALPSIRLAFFFIINSAISNPGWIDLDLSKSLIETLIRHAPTPEEIDVLKYLKFLLHIRGDATFLLDASEMNPYLRTHFHFQFISSASHLIEVMNACPIIPAELPFFIQGTMDDGFILLFIKNLYRLNLAHAEINNVLKAINPLILNKTHLPLTFDKDTDILFFIGQRYQSLKVNTRIFTLELHHPFFAKEWFGHLSFYILKIYQSMEESHPLDTGVISLLTNFFTELIQSNAPNNWAEFHSSPEEFWEICGKFLNYSGLSNFDFILFSQRFLPDIVDNLACFHLWSRLTVFLNIFFEHQKLGFGELDPSWIYLEILKEHLAFFDQLANLIRRTQPLDPVPALIELLDQTLILNKKDKRISAQFMKSLYPMFRHHLIQDFLAQLQLINHHLHLSEYTELAIDNLYRLQHLSHQFLTNLQSPRSALLLAQVYLKEQELFDLRTEALAKTEEKTLTHKVCKKKPKSKPLTKSTIKTTAEPDGLKTEIAKESIPACLFQLASDLKTEFNAKLILTGGAVTHLYLRRPNPHDYDCLVFNQDLGRLHDFLTKKDLLACHIIGKGHPVLKLKIADGSNLIEIEISCVASTKHHLDAAMADILAQRDFKLNALYLEINPDASSLTIKGFDHAIHSVNLRQIAPVDNPKRGLTRNIFSEDPVRVFRLVKIILQYPDFKPDGNLNRILKAQPLVPILQHYIQEDIHQARIGTCLDALFKRFDFFHVLHTLGEYKVIEGLSGLCFTTVQPYLGLLTDYLPPPTSISAAPGFFKPSQYQESSCEEYAYAKKLAFFQLITAIYFIENPKQDWPDWKSQALVRKIKPRDQDSLLRIHKAIQLQNPKLAREPKLVDFITAIMSEKPPSASKRA